MKTKTQAQLQKIPIRSMCSLRSRTINRFKTSKIASPMKSLTFTAVSVPNSKPSSPQRYINAATGTVMIVKNPKFKHLSYYRALLRSMNETKLRCGTIIKHEPLASHAIAL